MLPVQEPGNFLFSMPPENDNDFSAYSVGNQMVKGSVFSQPTEFDYPVSTDADQLDLLMNQYNDNIPPSLSDLTTSLGIAPQMNQDYYSGQLSAVKMDRYMNPEEVGGI